MENNKNSYIYYKTINPEYEYIIDIYYKIKNTFQTYNYNQFLELLECLKNFIYLICFDIKQWNYYNKIDNLINNISKIWN